MAPTTSPPSLTPVLMVHFIGMLGYSLGSDVPFSKGLEILFGG